MTLSERLISLPTFAILRCEGLFTVDTDGFDMQSGCVLLQFQVQGPVKPSEYWYQTQIPVQCPYSTTQWECLAVVWEVILLPLYLKGTKFVVRIITTRSNGYSTTTTQQENLRDELRALQN